MLYPKCFHRKIHPYITYHGYVSPCCWIAASMSWETPSIRDAFYHDLQPFHLDTQSPQITFTSPDWWNYLNRMGDPNHAYKVCKKSCPEKISKAGGSVKATDVLPFSSIVTGLHVEMTSRCTLACPKCARTLFPESFQTTDMSLEHIRAIAEQTIYHKILLCGNYGDPIYHRQFHEALQILLDHNKIVNIVTNGSSRSAKWWKETIRIITASPMPTTITFSVDGLADTNEVYRIGAKWESIQTALKMCSDADIAMVWKFIVFRHNQHQIDAAHEMADSYRMHFDLVYSNRYDGPDDPLKPDDQYVNHD